MKTTEELPKSILAASFVARCYEMGLLPEATDRAIKKACALDPAIAREFEFSGLEKEAWALPLIGPAAGWLARTAVPWAAGKTWNVGRWIAPVLATYLGMEALGGMVGHGGGPSPRPEPPTPGPYPTGRVMEPGDPWLSRPYRSLLISPSLRQSPFGTSPPMAHYGGSFDPKIVQAAFQPPPQPSTLAGQPPGPQEQAPPPPPQGAPPPGPPQQGPSPAFPGQLQQPPPAQPAPGMAALPLPGVEQDHNSPTTSGGLGTLMVNSSRPPNPPPPAGESSMTVSAGFRPYWARNGGDVGPALFEKEAFIRPLLAQLKNYFAGGVKARQLSATPARSSYRKGLLAEPVREAPRPLGPSDKAKAPLTTEEEAIAGKLPLLPRPKGFHQIGQGLEAKPAGRQAATAMGRELVEHQTQLPVNPELAAAERLWRQYPEATRGRVFDVLSQAKGPEYAAAQTSRWDQLHGIGVQEGFGKKFLKEQAPMLAIFAGLPYALDAFRGSDPEAQRAQAARRVGMHLAQAAALGDEAAFAKVVGQSGHPQISGALQGMWNDPSLRHVLAGQDAAANAVYQMHQHLKLNPNLTAGQLTRIVMPSQAQPVPQAVPPGMEGLTPMASDRRTPHGRPFGLTKGADGSLDSQGGSLPVIPSVRLKAADFITLPEGVEGTNCGNCLHAKVHGKGHVCTHSKLDGQPVTSKNCCILPGVMVSGDFLAGSEAWYSGEAVEVRTASGQHLRLTVNHPVLTKDGFVNAGLLQQGDYLVRHREDVEPVKGVGVVPAQHHVEDAPAPVEQVFRSLVAPGFVVEAATPFDFHGDGEFIKGNVKVVCSDSLLRGAGDTASPELQDEGVLALARFKQRLLAGECDLLSGQPVESVAGRPLCFRKTRPVVGHRHAGLTFLGLDDDSNTTQEAGDLVVVGAELPGEMTKAFAGRVLPDEVIEIERFHYEGPVYDFQTATGFILADSLWISNCAYWDNPKTLRTWKDDEKGASEKLAISRWKRKLRQDKFHEVPVPPKEAAEKSALVFDWLGRGVGGMVSGLGRKLQDVAAGDLPAKLQARQKALQRKLRPMETEQKALAGQRGGLDTQRQTLLKRQGELEEQLRPLQDLEKQLTGTGKYKYPQRTKAYRDLAKTLEPQTTEMGTIPGQLTPLDTQMAALDQQLRQSQRLTRRMEAKGKARQEEMSAEHYQNPLRWAGRGAGRGVDWLGQTMQEHPTTTGVLSTGAGLGAGLAGTAATLGFGWGAGTGAGSRLTAPRRYEVKLEKPEQDNVMSPSHQYKSSALGQPLPIKSPRPLPGSVQAKQQQALQAQGVAQLPPAQSPAMTSPKTPNLIGPATKASSVLTYILGHRRVTRGYDEGREKLTGKRAAALAAGFRVGWA